MTGSVVVVGIGNIGAPLCDHVARIPRVHRITVIDRDAYQEKNLWGQSISRSDIGISKARAQAAKLKSLRPDLEVVAYEAALEELPLGSFEGDVILSCLDSLESRMAVNEAAFRLGIPWVDAGVRSDPPLARVDVFLPRANGPCFECTFTQAHYDSLGTKYLCRKDNEPAPTNAPAFLGGLTASFQAAECDRILRWQAGEGANPESVQLIHSLETRETMISRNRRNAGCRFNHKVLNPIWCGLATLADLLYPSEADGNKPWFEAPGNRLATLPPCGHCGQGRPTLRTVARGEDPVYRCAFCGRLSVIYPELLFQRIPSERIPSRVLTAPLIGLGLRNGDLISVGPPGEERHFLVGEQNVQGALL